MYQKASRLKLRFQTPAGVLSTEQLWDLNLKSLAETVRICKEAITKSDDDELSFLEEESVTTDLTAKLRFDIVKDIFVTRKAELAEIKNAHERKAFEQKIMGIIKAKEDENLQNLSVDELRKMLEK